jgi:hypothetical protein
MKPCSRNRKRIAWLVLDALDAPQAAALRDHLARCEGCRRYWEDLSHTTEALTSASPDSSLEASESFHRRVAEKLQAVESGSVLDNLTAWLGGAMRNRRVALPAMAVAAIALIVVVASRYYPDRSRPVQPTVQVASASNSESELAPTIANYQRVANQSLEKLSELLTRQGDRSLPQAPVYTISSSEPANASF